jgi:hypothetical protein
MEEANACWEKYARVRTNMRRNEGSHIVQALVLEKPGKPLRVLTR